MSIADYRKVKSGDTLSIPSATWNGLLDMLAAFRASGGTKQPVKQASAHAADVVLVKNATGGNVEQFRALAIRSVVITPAVNEPEFKRRVLMSGTTPVTADAGYWGVLLDSLTSNQIGRIVVSGVTVCRINLADTTHQFAEIANASVIPTSAVTGLAQLIWVAGGVGTASATGEQWAVIRIGGGGSGTDNKGEYQYMAHVMVTQNADGFDFLRAHPLL